MFVDCFSRYTVLVPASNHTADTVSDALLRHVVPYFGTLAASCQIVAGNLLVMSGEADTLPGEFRES